MARSLLHYTLPSSPAKGLTERLKAGHHEHTSSVHKPDNKQERGSQMSSLFSGVLAIALVSSTPTIDNEQGFIVGYSGYAEGNYTQSHYIWTKLAKKNHARAQYGLAVMYEFGQGVRHSYAQAAHWYLKAAELDYAMAKNNLGMLHEKGLGVKQDLEIAVEYYRQAAEQGLASSQYNMGLMLSEGIGIKQDHKQAACWLLKAAEQGFASAQYRLGLVYQRGQGLKKNHIEAARWFIQAINTGATRAHSSLQALLKNKEAKHTSNQLTLRLRPSKSAGVVSQVSSGHLVYTLQHTKEWVGVMLDDKKTLGWVERATLK